MMVLHSEKQCRGVERSLSGGWAKGVSLLNEDFERPMIVVVYTYQDFCQRICTFARLPMLSSRTSECPRGHPASSIPSM